MMIRQVLVSLIILIFSAFAYADITLTDGYFETSFIGCDTGDVGVGYDCDGIVPQTPGQTQCTDVESEVSSNGNYSGGAGGNGWRMYMLGDNRNLVTTPMRVQFSTPQPSFWLRMYYRIPDGQLPTDPYLHKIIYAYTDDTANCNVNWPQGVNNISIEPRNTDSQRYGDSTNGWESVYGGSVTPADGRWQLFEFHFDLGDDGSENGIFRMWKDGLLIAEWTDIDWFNSGGLSPTGWDYIDLPSNHDIWGLDGCNPHDVDDIAVAIPTYTGFIQDTGSNNMIGPISSSTTPTSTASGSYSIGTE